MMSTQFHSLNCKLPSQHLKIIRPWVVQGLIDGISCPCTEDIGCNLTTNPISLVKLVNLKIFLADRMVSIADGTSYKPLEPVSVLISVEGYDTKVEALVCSGDNVLLRHDRLSLAGCMLDIARRRMTINLLEDQTKTITLAFLVMSLGTRNLGIPPISSNTQTDNQFD